MTTATDNLNHNRKTLIVDSNRIICRLLEESLSQKGQRVTVEADVAKAEKNFRQGDFDLIICNLDLPQISGLQFFEKLRSLDPDVAMILLAAKVSPKDYQQLMRIGVYDLLTIPFQLDSVLASVDHALEKRDLVLRNKELLDQQQNLIEKLLVSNKQLTELGRLKTEFITNVSHELLTPLTSLGMLTYNMAQGIVGPFAPAQQEYVVLMRKEIARLTRLLKDLFTTSKLELHTLRLELKPFAIRDALAHCVNIFRPLAEAQGKRVVLLETSDEYEAIGDREKTEEILMNLIDNAVKFSKKSGEITVNAKAENGSVRVSVRDTGVGIAAADFDKIFDRFVQVNRANRSGYQGTGLGLFIVKSLVELQNGKIWLESELGKGSTFYFTLPTHDAQNRQGASGIS